MSHCVHFASDLHLGAPNTAASHARERRFVAWLRDAAEGRGFAQGSKATEIHVVGDLFDFWFEYRRAVPKGGVRVLGALAELTDAGLPVHFHAGNHDMWTMGYLSEELGVQVHKEPIRCIWDGVECLVGHGDGLGPGDARYKRIKRVFQSNLCQQAFRWVHPDLGIALAHAWSAHSRRRGELPVGDMALEHLVQYAESLKASKDGQDIDVFVFGHRHAPIDTPIAGGQARYLNLGDWITHHTSVCLQGGEARLIHHQI